MPHSHTIKHDALHSQIWPDLQMIRANHHQAQNFTHINILCHGPATYTPTSTHCTSMTRRYDNTPSRYTLIGVSPIWHLSKSWNWLSLTNPASPTYFQLRVNTHQQKHHWTASRNHKPASNPARGHSNWFESSLPHYQRLPSNATNAGWTNDYQRQLTTRIFARRFKTISQFLTINQPVTFLNYQSYKSFRPKEAMP